MLNNLTAQNRPLLVELIGPAGAGKTTLIKALCQKNRHIMIAPKPSYRYARNIPFLVSNVLPLLPVFLRQRPNSRWLTRREIWWMIYLNGWHHILGQQTSNSCLLNVIDHGPVYMLTSLLEFGPEITQAQYFQKWWNRILVQWATFLDMVIWLDAPNLVLENRINTRDTWHVVKEKPEQVVHKFLTRYRSAYEQVISMLTISNNSPSVLQFNTDLEPLSKIVDKVLVTFNLEQGEV